MPAGPCAEGLSNGLQSPIINLIHARSSWSLRERDEARRSDFRANPSCTLLRETATEQESGGVIERMATRYRQAAMAPGNIKQRWARRKSQSPLVRGTRNHQAPAIAGGAPAPAATASAIQAKDLSSGPDARRGDPNNRPKRPHPLTSEMSNCFTRPFGQMREPIGAAMRQESGGTSPSQGMDEGVRP